MNRVILNDRMVAPFPMFPSITGTLQSAFSKSLLTSLPCGRTIATLMLLSEHGLGLRNLIIHKGEQSVLKKQDSIYAAPLTEIIDFHFDVRVTEVFPDMIQRSVPGYATMISMIGILAGKYAQAGSHCYDLGCSLGAVSLAMRQCIGHPDCDIIAVDNSPAMIERGQELLAADSGSPVQVNMVCANIQDVSIENASIVVLNLTLQFIPLAERQELIKRIYRGLNTGGVLILSEKLAFDEHGRQRFHTQAHHDFKRANGYSDLEISQKRSALERVLIPETLASHQQRLKDAGFDFTDVWFQCFNFASLIAVK